MLIEFGNSDEKRMQEIEASVALYLKNIRRGEKISEGDALSELEQLLHIGSITTREMAEGFLRAKTHASEDSEFNETTLRFLDKFFAENS